MREAWRRMQWQKWLARGTLLGLCAATVFSLAVFITQRSVLLQRHPSLDHWWWPYVSLGVCTLMALLAVLSRLRHAVTALLLLSAAMFLLESQMLGWGLHLARIPTSLLLVIWADRALRA